MIRYKELMSSVAKELGVTEDFVNKVYKAYWKKIRDIILELPLKEELTEEQFNQLRPNISINNLGKFNVLYQRYFNIKNYYNIQQQIRENKQHDKYKEDQANEY